VAGVHSDRHVRVLLSIDADELPDAHAAAGGVLRALRMHVVDDEQAPFDIFIGVYGARYGEMDPRLGLSRLEQHYLLAGQRPRLVYVLPPAQGRDQHLSLLLSRIQADDLTSYRKVKDAAELRALLADDLAVLLTEAFTGGTPRTDDPVIETDRDRGQPPRSRIPAPWHRLVGRDKEVGAVCGMLEAGCRLVSVTGPGGIGKSRFAIEVASTEHSRYPDGAWFVDLAGVSDPALLAPTIAQSFGVRESAAVNPVESLKLYLSSMTALLLLDSFETVTAAAPVLIDLLSAAPGIQILVTSRSVLRVRGEQEYPLQPLAVPEHGARCATAPGPALELFLERAAAANPSRTFDEGELTAAAEICRRLEGVPLALELAAARTRLLPASVLLGKLEHALEVLTDGPLDLPARQRTLRTTIDWDHNLLGLEEQMLFRRLAVFPRQFTLAAAEIVTGEPALDVMEGVDSLLGKSLLRTRDPGGIGEPVFVMLQAVHDYAFERLEESGEVDDLRRRHALYVLSRAERAGSAPPSESERWLAMLEREHADIRAALNWADTNVDVDVLLRLTAALGSFWRAHCHFSEGRRWLDRALSLSAGQRTETRVDLLNAAGFLSRARGDYDTADSQYREALAIREEIAEPNKVAGSMRFIGNVAYDRGDLDEADRWWRMSLETLEGTGDESRRMSVLNNLGIVAHHRGDEEEALALYDQTYEYAVRLGAAEHRARAQMNRALSLTSLGRLDEAQSSARAAVGIYAGLDDTWNLVDAVDVLAGAVGRSGATEDSGWLYGGAASLRAALDVRRPASEQGDYDESFAESRKHDPDAFDAAFATGESATVNAIIDRATGREASP
jgi:predicted ATPase